ILGMLVAEYLYKKYPKYGKHAPVVTLVPFRDDLSCARGDIPRAWFGSPLRGAFEGVDMLDNEWVSPNVLRIFPKRKFAEDAPLGSTYRLLHYYYGKSGIKMEANRHLTLENIDILSCRGHAIYVTGEQQFWQYINVNVRPPANDPLRAVSSTADHHHVANSKGFMKLLGCAFTMGNDDCGNFHDNSYFGKRGGDPCVLLPANLRGIGLFSPKPGEELELFQDDYSPANWRGKIVKIDGEKIFLDKPLPEQKGEGFVCFKTRYGTRNIIVRDCDFVRHTARGLLILAKDVTIENCRFGYEQHGSIKFETGYTKRQWCEGYGVDNAVVRGCVFRMCNISGRASQGFVRDIMLAAYMKTDPSDEQPACPIIKNVLFENNKFYDLHGLVATISGSENVVFRNNEIHAGGECGGDLWYKGGFAVIGGKNIFIVDNAFFGDVPFAGVIEKKGAVENLNASGNRKISE
ncbi:MAG: right-handed parallel beta-helix repeat-containing protein, partial [Opitutales bacterium]|nr:right-handed parallel beta-helix repeat-containing protein [Opitutales bacterium]